MTNESDNVFLDDLHHEPMVMSPSDLNDYLIARQRILNEQAESFGHEVRQFLVTINLGGIAGTLTYIAALKSTSELAIAWMSLAFFCAGIIAVGVVLAINVLSFRVHLRDWMELSARLSLGRSGGVSLAEFEEGISRSAACLRRSSRRADFHTYVSAAFACSGLVALIVSVYLYA